MTGSKLTDGQMRILEGLHEEKIRAESKCDAELAQKMHDVITELLIEWKIKGEGSDDSV